MQAAQSGAWFKSPPQPAIIVVSQGLARNGVPSESCCSSSPRGHALACKAKAQLSAVTASAALSADAAESAVCGYLAPIALAGLVVNVIWRVSWADPIAALFLLPLVVREGREAIKGKPCCHEV